MEERRGCERQRKEQEREREEERGRAEREGEREEREKGREIWSWGSVSLIGAVHKPHHFTEEQWVAAGRGLDEYVCVCVCVITCLKQRKEESNTRS